MRVCSGLILAGLACGLLFASGCRGYTDPGLTVNMMKDSIRKDRIYSRQTPQEIDRYLRHERRLWPTKKEEASLNLGDSAGIDDGRTNLEMGVR